MTMLTTIRHHGPVEARGICDGEAVAITTSSATEVFARCAPVASGTSKNGCRVQSRVIYENLARLLDQGGSELGDVVIEKAFFRNLAADFDDFQQARLAAYRRRGITGEALPALTCLQQPPCRKGQDVELQAYAVFPATDGEVRVRSVSPSPEDVSVKLVDLGPVRSLYIGNIGGHHGNGRLPGRFRRQSDQMFATAGELLRSQGASFSEVVRTWIYLDDIDRDYADLNASRNAFFEREGIRRLPASTGIGGGSRPSENRCTLDLYALLNPDIAQIEVMQTPTLNEAPEYGSAFSRGMRMALPDQTYLFISGTASVDEAGATVHLGDRKAQIERMLLNIDELLRPHGASWADLVQAVTFLKSADDLELFQQVCAERGVPAAHNTIVEADVCRPELLCEMEAIAVLPTPK